MNSLSVWTQQPSQLLLPDFDLGSDSAGFSPPQHISHIDFVDGRLLIYFNHDRANGFTALRHAKHVAFDAAFVGNSPSDALGAELVSKLETLMPRCFVVAMVRQDMIPLL